jgi:PAS domain-containing protein
MNQYLTPLDKWLDTPIELLRDEVFRASQAAASEIESLGAQADDARDITIRMRALFELRQSELSDFLPMIEALTREVGLFPYLDDSASFRDTLAREAFRSEFDPDFVFHVEQQRIYSALLAGKNVIASAPTSFGKSLIIDSIVQQPNINRIAIIVPTLALLDETRRRLIRKLSGHISVIFNRTQRAPPDGKVIFLGTQERLLDRLDIIRLDILIVDEFYKADPTRSDGRFIALNAAISRLSKITRQFFFIGPFIDGVDVSGWRYADVEFMKTSYRTVAVDSIDVQAAQDNVAELARHLGSGGNRPALVFVKSPKSAGELAVSLTNERLELATHWSAQLSAWVAENYAPDWSLVSALNRGIGYHHGRLPRALASALVRGFNLEKFPVLLCTSTLIEGVNTAAKSVFIWDKKIDGKDVDFFTFCNIRGRAGRMGRHYVGKAFHFHPAPHEVVHEIEIPGLSSATDVDEILVHYDAEELSEVSRRRLADWAAATGLSLEELKRFSGLGFSRLEALKNAVDQLSLDDLRLLCWRRMPDYNELKATAHLLWSVFDLRRSGPRSADQLTFFLWRVYKSGSMTAFLERMLRGQCPAPPDDLFGFLRSCEFNFPEMLACLQLSLARNKGGDADYSVFLAQLENWFLQPAVKSLEEVGLPVVLFEKLNVPVFTDATVDDLVLRAQAMARNRTDLSVIEREMISAALV